MPHICNISIKKTITNWTNNPINCKTMSKLLNDCLIKSTKTSPCSVYRTLLLECINTKK